MKNIKVEHSPSLKRLEELGIKGWQIWEKEESEFPWCYDEAETCYFLEGDVIMTPKGGKPMQIGKGDLVTFPKGMSCTWKICKAVKKHYRFG